MNSHEGNLASGLWPIWPMSKVKIFAPVEEKKREATDAPPTDALAMPWWIPGGVRVYADDPIPAEVMDATWTALKAPNCPTSKLGRCTTVSPEKKQVLVEAPFWSAAGTCRSWCFVGGPTSGGATTAG